MRYWLIFLILGVFLSGCGGGGGILPESLELLGFNPPSGPPGRAIKVDCTGTSIGLADLYVEFGETRVPAMTPEDGKAIFYVPFLNPGSYEVNLECKGKKSGNVTFGVEASKPVPYSQSDFAFVFSNGSKELNQEAREWVQATDQQFDFYSDADMAEIESLFADLDKIYSDLNTQILALPPEQADLLQSFLFESGSLAILDEFRNAALAQNEREVSANTIPHHTLFKSDITSMLIKNLDAVVGAATIISLIASGGADAPIIALGIEVKIALKLTAWVIDTLIPTDLFKIDLVIDENKLFVGNTVHPAITGHFRCEDSAAKGTFSMQLDIALDALFETVPVPVTVREKISKAVIEKIAGLGIDLETYLLGKMMKDHNGPFVADYQTPLDMTIYRGDMGDILNFVFPTLPVSSVLSFLESVGFVPPTIVDSVAISNPSIMSYDYIDSYLQCKGTGKTQIQAAGFRMEKKTFWTFDYKFLTMVPSPVVNIEIKPANQSPGLANTPWPKKNHDLKNTCRSPYIGAQSATLKWKFQTGDAVLSSPTIDFDSTIYIGSLDGFLYAVNPSGSMKWKAQTGKIDFSSPTISANRVIYIGSADGLYAINASDGSIKWRFETGDINGSSPAIGADGTVYIGNRDGTFYAINADGSLKWDWTFYLTWGILSSPAVGSDGMVYFGTIDEAMFSYGYFWALDPNDGSENWSIMTKNYIHSSPSIAQDGTIYIANDDGVLYSLSSSGEENWKYIGGGMAWSTPAIGADGTIYFTTREDMAVRAITSDGKLKWKYALDSELLNSSPAIGADGTIYLGAWNGVFYAFNGANGSLKWWYQTGDGIESSPAIGADGTVFVGSSDGYLYAFHD